MDEGILCQIHALSSFGIGDMRYKCSPGPFTVSPARNFLEIEKERDANCRFVVYHCIGNWDTISRTSLVDEAGGLDDLGSFLKTLFDWIEILLLVINPCVR